MKRAMYIAALILMFGLVLSACAGTPSPAREDYEYGQDAVVEALEVIVLESYPVQTRVRVSGYLPDGCTELHDISVDRVGSTVTLTLTTRRPTGEVACTEALVPFEEIVDLDIGRLEPPYKIIAQSQETTITLEAYDVSPVQGDDEFIYGNKATLEELGVNVLDSMPVQVIVTLSGYLPDGCIEIETITAAQKEDVFTIEIVTRRPAGDVACTMAIVPFEEDFILDVEGLAPGTYTVVAQDKQATFSLDAEDPSQAYPGDQKFDYGTDARLESLSVNIMESFPVQVSVSLQGYLPDGCTQIHEITSERQEDLFTIEIVTRRPAGDISCTQAIVPFEETVSLDVEGLPAGEYTVQSGDFEEIFTLEQDNVVQ
jgi:hypothetical protein